MRDDYSTKQEFIQSDYPKHDKRALLIGLSVAALTHSLALIIIPTKEIPQTSNSQQGTEFSISLNETRPKALSESFPDSVPIKNPDKQTSQIKKANRDSKLNGLSAPPKTQEEKLEPPIKTSQPDSKPEENNNQNSNENTELSSRDSIVFNPQLQERLNQLTPKAPAPKPNITTFTNVYSEDVFQMDDKCFKRVESGDPNQADTWSLPKDCPGVKSESDKIANGLKAAMKRRRKENNW